MKRSQLPENLGNIMPKHNSERRDLLKNAAFGGTAQMAASILGFAEPAFANQNGWRMCSKCLGMYRTSGTSLCPADHTPHATAGTHHYSMIVGGTTGTTAAGQQGGWRHCNQCSGMFYAVATGNHMGVCPAGGTHQTGATPTQFAIQFGVPAAAGLEDGWRWCSQCMGLWHPSVTSPSACPAGGAHTEGGSGQYVASY